MKPESAAPRHILIVKLSAIGDVIQTLPMLAAMRREFPEAKIDWVVEEEAADLLVGHPGIDRLMVSRRKSWLRNFRRRGTGWAAMRELFRFIQELRETEYDWVIDNHGVLKSGILVGLSRGKRKIGYRAAAGIATEGNYLFTRERYRPLPLERHALERYLDLVRQLGVPTEGISLEYPVAAAEAERVRRLLDSRGFGGRPLAVIHPRAKWDTKQWAPERFSELAERLAAEGSQVVFTGSPGDAADVERILGRIRPSASILNLTGQTDLRKLAALFSLADLVITPDTGPMHLAAAVKAPLVAIFGPTAPWRTGPYGAGHAVLRKELPCSPCFRKNCPTRECLDQLTVEDVLKAAEERIAERRVAWP
jgi:lipopolysaccharide heptosyltransferase I